jgi:hypothetical protein
MSPPPVPGGAWTKKVLYSFTGGDDGADPGNVTFGSDNQLCGITWAGGGFGLGTVFALTL